VVVLGEGCDLADDFNALNLFIEEDLAQGDSQRDHIHMQVWFVEKRYPVWHATFLVSREVAISVRLNIRMDDDLYARLKKKVPSQKLSTFITEAVRAKLHPDARTLNAAYQSANKEQWRAGLAEDWKHID